jgi:hypothetical protein
MAAGASGPTILALPQIAPTDLRRIVDGEGPALIGRMTDPLA